MPKFKISVTTELRDEAEASEVSRLLGSTFTKVETEDLKKLLRAVEKNPSLVKTATKFI